MRRSGEIRAGGDRGGVSGRQERGEGRPRLGLGLRPCPGVVNSGRRRPRHRKIEVVGYPNRVGACHGDRGDLEEQPGGSWRRGKPEDT